MDTLIQGQPAEWTTDIRAKWYEVTKGIEDGRGPVTRANYWHPTPAVDRWNRGRTTEGFTYTVAHRYVWQVTINP